MTKFYYFITVCLISLLLLESCSGNIESKKDASYSDSSLNPHSASEIDATVVPLNGANIITTLHLKRQLIKLSHHINTAANEYLPVLSDDENKLYFSATNLDNQKP